MLSREEGGCKIILEQGGLTKLKQLLLSKEDLKILQAGVRVLGGLTHNSKERVGIQHHLRTGRSGQAQTTPTVQGRLEDSPSWCESSWGLDTQQQRKGRYTTSS